MSRIAYVNGRYRPLRDAHVHIEDRGYQFADGVYEVCEVRDGRLVDERRHLERLQRSLSELRIRLPMPLPALSVVLHETMRRNRVRDGIVYLQIPRGAAPAGPPLSRRPGPRPPWSSPRARSTVRKASAPPATALRLSRCPTN